MTLDEHNALLRRASILKMAGLAKSVFNERAAQQEAAFLFHDAALLHLEFLDRPTPFTKETLATHLIEACGLMLDGRDPSTAIRIAGWLEPLRNTVRVKRPMIERARAAHQLYMVALKPLREFFEAHGSLQNAPTELVEAVVAEWPGVGGGWWALYRARRDSDFAEARKALEIARRLEPSVANYAAFQLDDLMEEPGLSDSEYVARANKIAERWRSGEPEVDLMLAIVHVRVARRTQDRQSPLLLTARDLAARAEATAAQAMAARALVLLRYIDGLREGSAAWDPTDVADGLTVLDLRAFARDLKAKSVNATDEMVSAGDSANAGSPQVV